MGTDTESNIVIFYVVHFADYAWCKRRDTGFFSMKKSLLPLAIALAGSAAATPFTGNDAQSNAMGNTGVASATPQNAFQYNPGLLADYSDSVDFGLTLPSIKFFMDDSKGFIDSAGAFIEEGGTWDEFQTVDAAALQTAVSNLSPTLTAITANITDISSAITDLENASDESDVATAIISLNTASSSLSTNAGALNTDAKTVSNQMSNLNTTTSTAKSDLEGLSGKPLQLGLGIDVLNVAIPNENLGMALSISTTTSVGTSFSIAGEDLNPVVNLTTDLTGFSSEATKLTEAVNDLAAANADLTAYFENRPSRDDSPLEYAQWANGLDEKQQAISNAQQDVINAQSGLQTYDGPNETITNGEITLTDIGDPQSEIEIVGANISELGVSVARKFNFAGEDVAIGVTPKLQSINIFEKTISLNSAEDEADSISSDPAGYFLDNTTMLYRGNIDIGAAKSWDFHGQARAGVAIKDLIPWTLESKSGTELLIRPKIRIGAAHETQFSKVAIDLDITENKPLKYGVPTRYLGIGAELNAWNHAAIRVGYRNNLSVDNSHVISGGIGLTPFGTGLNISAWIKPTFDDPVVMIQDVGAVAQFSVNF